MRPAAVVAIALTALGCAAPLGAPESAGLGPHPHQIGPARVFILRAADVQATCRSLARGAGLPSASKHYLGCYAVIDGVPTVVSVDDVYVLLHEFKHLLEPEWRHR